MVRGRGGGACTGRDAVPQPSYPARPWRAGGAPDEHNPIRIMHKAWKRALDRLSAELSAEDVQTWLKPLQAKSRGGSLLLLAPNGFVADKVRKLYLPRISEWVAALDPSVIEVRVELGTEELRPAEAAERPITTPVAEPVSVEFRFDSKLDSRYHFDNFVEGKSNQLARATALQVALKPGQAYNPCLLYGGTGLGKTHLLHAAGNLIARNNPRARVLYVRSEEFIRAMIHALQQNKMDDFKRSYRTVDALLIDDIQFLAGKDRTQEEFFHLFNALYDAKQQIIMTCDRYPKEVDKLEPRLKSRFGWGISVAVDPPDFETRVAILLSKAASAGMDLNEDVAAYIARRMRSNVRELEGALNTLHAHANLLGRAEVDLAFAQSTLRDVLRPHEQQISLSNIQKTVSDYHRMPLTDLLGKKRTRSLVRPRQMAMALAKELTSHSLPEIGHAFGGRDHTTVLHACKVIRELVDTDSRTRDDWDKLVRLLSV
jgi:chromosomal replication initiator protein